MTSKDENSKWTLFSLKCCNPLKEEKHKKSQKLRSIPEWMWFLGFENVKPGMKICDNCRLKINKLYKDEQSNSNKLSEKNSNDMSIPGPSTRKNDTDFVDPNSSLDFLNKSLELVGESPIKKKKLKSSDTYTKQKLEKVKITLEKTFLEPKPVEAQPQNTDNDEFEIIKQLKRKFAKSTKRSEKMTILSVLPISWSRSRIKNEFGVTDYMARAVKKMVREKGILSSPNAKPGKTLDDLTVQLVVDFYNREDVTRVMPGKKDVVAVTEKNEPKVYLQKRLILVNLKELFELFKTEHPNRRIGFSKFCELRPRNCILAGKSGTHTVCVCMIHQNVKLMMNATKMNTFKLSGDDTEIRDFKHCLCKIMCNPPAPDCYLDKCEMCPGIGLLQESLSKMFEDEMIDRVTYKRWLNVDRCTLETVVKDKDEFIDEFMQDLFKLKTHSFIATMQKEFYNEVKATLKSGEILITCDFAENYSFVLQDEVQSFHWNNVQATLHPFVVYFKEDEKEKLNHLNYVFISECLIHDTVAFNLFQTILINDLKTVFPNLTRIVYFSDGCAGQYKNCKNFLNVCHHQKDFGVNAEWHFFATSHGKSACDGLGGTVKRLASKASLQRPYEQQILTPKQLYEFSTTSIPGINFKYCTSEQYNENEKKLKERLDEAKTVKGTRKLHAIIPISETTMDTKLYSLSFEKKTEQLISSAGIAEDLTNIESGFVTVEYNKSWWLACILAKNESNETKVSFLHPQGPAASFYYPQPKPDILVVQSKTVLKKVDPRTATGRTYTLTSEEMTESSVILQKKIKKV